MASVTLWAQPVPEGPEFLVNTFTQGSQGGPAIAGAPSGDFVVVWNSAQQDGSPASVFGQLFDSLANPVGLEFQVNISTVGFQQPTRAGMDGDGNFLVAWRDLSGQDGSGIGVFGRRFAAGGAPAGGEFQVNTFTTDSQMNPSVAADSAGNFIIAWRSDGQDGSSLGVYAQRYDPLGAVLQPEFPVNTYTTGSQSTPDVATDGAGNFVIVWHSFGQDGDGYGIFGQRYDSLGVTTGIEFPVNTFTTGDQHSPSVAMNSAGEFVVAWASEYQDGSPSDIVAQQFDAAGAPRAGEFRVNSNTTGSQTLPDVALDPAGAFVVVWRDLDGLDGDGLGVFGQRFDSSGTSQGGDFQLSTFTVGIQSYPAVAVSNSGDFVVVWHSRDQDGSEFGVFGQRFRTSCAPMPGPATNLTLELVNGGADLELHWLDGSDADEHVVLSDGAVDGPFHNAVGNSVSQTITVPAPQGTMYYLVAGRNTTCGQGPSR